MIASRTQVKKGLFSKVFIEAGKNTVRIESDCYNKDCVALFMQDSFRKYVPKINQVDNGTYESPYYNTPKSMLNSLKKSDIVFLRELKDMQKQHISFLRKNNCNHDSNYHFYHDMFTNSKILTKYQKTLMIDWLDNLANYGSDMVLEIANRNLALDHNGNLILLDIWFFASQKDNKLTK